jgi:hypothetical protein
MAGSIRLSSVRVQKASVLLILMVSFVAARKVEKVEEEAGWGEFAWNGLKFCFAMSPLIAMGSLLYFATDDEEAEEAKRKRAKENGKG